MLLELPSRKVEYSSSGNTLRGGSLHIVSEQVALAEGQDSGSLGPEKSRMKRGGQEHQAQLSSQWQGQRATSRGQDQAIS